MGRGQGSVTQAVASHRSAGLLTGAELRNAIKEEEQHLLAELPPAPSTAALSAEEKAWLVSVGEAYYTKMTSPGHCSGQTRRADAFRDEIAADATDKYNTNLLLQLVDEAIGEGLSSEEQQLAEKAREQLAAREEAQVEFWNLKAEAHKNVMARKVAERNKAIQDLPAWQPVPDFEPDPERHKHLSVAELYDGLATVSLSDWPREDEDGHLRFAKEVEHGYVDFAVDAEELRTFLAKYRHYPPSSVEDYSETGIAKKKAREIEATDVFAVQVVPANTPGSLPLRGYKSDGSETEAPALAPVETVDLTYAALKAAEEAYWRAG